MTEMDASQYPLTPVEFPYRFAGQDLPVVSFLDTDQDKNVYLYFALKGKHGRTAVNHEAFWERLREVIADLPAADRVVVYPESSKDFLRRIAACFPCPSFEIPKNPKDAIIAKAATHKWGRQQWASQQARFAEMTGGFEINKLKTNQRPFYVPLLFNAAAVPLPPAAEVLLLDDSLFSGTTAKACLTALQAAGRPADRIMTLFYCSGLAKNYGQGIA